MTSILNDTKKVLGLAPEYVVFDLDIIQHINAAFAVVHQLGVGPENGYFITDEENDWDELAVDPMKTNLTKTYVFLKVKQLFDPPTTSFHIEAVAKQLSEYEWRLNVSRELDLPTEEEVTTP